MAEDEKEKKALLAKSEISLLLDTYDDIFSDFDPRPYSQRALSDDFLNEARKASREKGESFELRFLMYARLRNSEHESVIKKRLHEHFKKHTANLKKEIENVMIKGVILAVLGFVMMVGATVIAEFVTKSLLSSFLMVVLEPSGWFAVWMGFDSIFSVPKEKKPELVFNEKMSKADIIFESY
jgi:hypothetical protein